MHSYLRAIGFGNIKKESEAERLLEEVYKSFDHREAVKDGQSVFLEMEKEFAPDMGIMLCGDLDQEGFHRQYYFPYYKGNGITTTEDIIVEKRVNGDSFSGVCDDGRVGVSLIFSAKSCRIPERADFKPDVCKKDEDDFIRSFHQWYGIASCT